MRPSFYYVTFILSVICLDGMFIYYAGQGKSQQQKDLSIIHDVTKTLGLTDICVTTEARYTRHPAVSDILVPFMDHPGGMEHFPSGSFFSPPYTNNLAENR